MKNNLQERLNRFRERVMPSLTPFSGISSSTRVWLLAAFELFLIGLFAAWVGRAYLNLDPRELPFGRELMMVIQSHNLWDLVKECGWCAVWNGSTSGGYPAFAELYGAPLHPIIAVTTAIWGVVNGTKIALLTSLWVAGVAQWWIARELKLGWLPRIWTALIAITGGHLAGRMEAGAATLTFSTAIASLVIPGLLMVARRRDGRSVVMLAIVSASAILGGQGYLQIGLVFTLPALLFFLFDRKLRLQVVWKKYVLAGVLALMLAAPLLVPLIHFLPEFGKPIDPDFQSVQPLEYLALNLVINDTEFYYTSEVLGRIRAPAPYTLYIGWVPVVLAVLGIGLSRREDRKQINFLAWSTLFVFMVSSGAVLKWLIKTIPSLAAIRFPSFIAGLVIPMILGLAAYGLDLLLKHDWPSLMIRLANSRGENPQGFSLRWVLVIPLIINLRSTTAFTRVWLTSLHQGDDVPWVVENLRTDDLQWVSPPFGEHYFITPAIASGLKISPGLKPWGWEENAPPLPNRESIRGELALETVELLASDYGIFVYEHMGEYYAAVQSEFDLEACMGNGMGGRLQIHCENSARGRLIVKENMWTGWKAWRDGESVPLLGERWLEVEAPAGSHTYIFEYRPWDVPLGLLLLLFGIVFCAWSWRRPDPLL
jgi:hypothetical protein